jgi:hypothetical protein
MRAGVPYIQLTRKGRLKPLYVLLLYLSLPGLSRLALLPRGLTYPGAHLRILSLLSLFPVACTCGACIPSFASMHPCFRSLDFNQTRHFAHQLHQIPPV